MTESINLRDNIASALLNASNIVLRASGVQRIGTPAVQVILAGWFGAQREGLAFSVDGASSAFTAAFVDLGLGASPVLTRSAVPDQGAS